MGRVVHIVGTGTIGEPLIGLFSSLREPFGIDEVTFHKKTPLTRERAKVNSLLRRGGKLAVSKDRVAGFEKLGHKVSFTAREAIERATVVIDCTPDGNQNKAKYAEISGPLLYMAQGTEFGFGMPYARGVNDDALDRQNRFVQIVSCNTHNICVMIKTLGMKRDDSIGVTRGQFVCIRRASDISEDDGFISAPVVEPHTEERFGTRHARDAHALFQTMGLDLNLFSSSCRVPTQYMHTLQFTIDMEQATTRERLLAAMAENPRIALTERTSAALVFSFGRDHGYFGRILNEAVVPSATLHLGPHGKTVSGFAFAPQDGNSLLSTIACTLSYMYGGDPGQRLEHIRQYMFQEI